MTNKYDSIVDTVETPLIARNEDRSSLSKKRFSLVFVGSLLVAAVLGTVAVQHIASPRQAQLSEGSAGIVSTSRSNAHVRASPSAMASSRGDGMPTTDGFADDETEAAYRSFAQDSDNEDEEQAGLLAQLGKSVASLGGCSDKKVSGCLVHKKSWCSSGFKAGWFDNGKCETCYADYDKKSDTKCEKCSDDSVSNCLTHDKEMCGTLTFDNGKCITCDAGYERSSDWKSCNKCEGDVSVSNCLTHDKEMCGVLTYDNGKCITCDVGYERSDDWKSCNKCKDDSVDHCAIHDKEWCSAAWYDAGTCGMCIPGCDLKNSKKECDCSFWDEQWDEFKEDPLGYLDENIVGPVEDSYNYLNDQLDAAIEWVTDLFDGHNCEIDVDSFQNIWEIFLNNMAPDFNSIMNVFSGKQDDFIKGLGGPVCDYIWTIGFPAGDLLLDAVNAVATVVERDCPVVKIDTEFAVTLGFTLAAGVSNAGKTVGASLELGLGFDLQGRKFCYVGGCVEEGITFSPDPSPSFDKDVGVAVTFHQGMSAVPGRCSVISGSVDLAIPIGTPSATAGIGVVLAVGGDNDGQPVGVSFAAGTDPFASKPEFSLSFAVAECLTPLCVTTDGEHCNPEYAAEVEATVAGLFGQEAEDEFNAAKPPSPPPPPPAPPEEEEEEEEESSSKWSKIAKKWG